MTQKAGFFKRIKLALRQPKDSVVFRTAEGVWEHKLDSTVLQQPGYDRLQLLDVYANFAAIVYHDRDADDTHAGEVNLAPSGWQRVLDGDDADRIIDEEKSVRGLKYEAWYSAESKQLVIAFRGSGKRLGDWFSNFRWVTRIIPGVEDHYDLVRENIQGVLARAQQASGQIDSIVTTGHSLGGGLAQHAAYSSAQISAAYAFNPTPVTGYSSVDESSRNENTRNLFIARVFEHGEVLAYLRFGLRYFYKISASDPTIVELRFNFAREPGVLREHGMREFAKSVWQMTHQIRSVAGQQS